MIVIEAQLRVGDFILEEFNREPPNWMPALFADSEYRSYIPTDEERVKYPRHHWGEASIQEMTATAGAICDRLDLIGFTPARLNSGLKAWAEYQLSYGVEQSNLAAFHNFDAYISALSRAMQDPELRTASILDGKVDSLATLLGLWNDAYRSLWDGLDSRMRLRSVAAASDRDVAVVLKLQMVESKESHDLARNRRMALDSLNAEFGSQAPVVVLTEGTTDQSILKMALAVLYPHLCDYIRFLEYSTSNKPELNAAAVVRTVKAFSAAGIGNRIVAILDNDAAGTVAFESLDYRNIAPNIRVLRYPNIDLGRRYPVIGSEGDITYTDVNGLAGSIELYLGLDVLTYHGRLTPVRLSKSDGQSGARQGQLLYKRDLQRRFKNKARETLDGLRDFDELSWREMRNVVDSIRNAFNEP